MEVGNLLAVIDTHALVWYFVGNDRLPSTIKDQVDQARRTGRILVPTIVLAEALYIAENERVIDDEEEVLDFEGLYEKVVEDDGFRIVDFGREVLEETIGLEGVPELHDRIIAATARFHGATVLTKDSEIEPFKP